MPAPTRKEPRRAKIPAPPPLLLLEEAVDGVDSVRWVIADGADLC